MVILMGPIFEINYLKYFCFPICVVHVSDEKVLIKRLALRDNISEEEAIDKINLHPPI
jgi:dephospho-CoA kinase